MYLIDYKLLYRFQKEAFNTIRIKNKFGKKIVLICELLQKYIPQSKFEFINNQLNFDKDILTNPYNRALVSYSDNLLDMILKEKAKREEVDFIINNDVLTGLKNKNAFENALRKDKKKKNLILLAIDNFSYINTEYDCNLGNLILVEVTKMLKYLCEDKSLYRINAVEFAILYKEQFDMVKLIKKIQKYFFKNDIIVDGLIFHISFTYGAFRGKEMLYKKAFIALKEAKQQGKNRYRIYKDDKNVEDNYKTTDFIHWNHIIHNALKNSTLVPFFQGVYDEEKSKISTYEVLVRIEHEDGYYLPHEFLEVAKLSGVLPKITRVMIDKSFAFMSKHSCRFSINITEEDLDEDFLLRFLEKKSRLYGIKQDRLTLEILENISSNSSKNHLSQLIELKQAGYKIAIDDFGTQYSNFERLLDLDIDYLKLDAKYIKNIDTDKKSEDIVKSIAMFAKKNNIPCIAEFVHNKKIAKKVKNLGIEYSQGYYYSKPNIEI